MWPKNLKSMGAFPFAWNSHNVGKFNDGTGEETVKKGENWKRGIGFGSQIAQESGDPIPPPFHRLCVAHLELVRWIIGANCADRIGRNPGIGVHQRMPNQLGIAKIGEKGVECFHVVRPFWWEGKWMEMGINWGELGILNSICWIFWDQSKFYY